MIDEELAAFAAGGRALIVGAVDDDGCPHATRGWGFCLDADRVPTVLLDAADHRGLQALGPGRAIAVTAADVPTLRSIQFKGVVLSIEAPEESDGGLVVAYVDAFHGAIEESDGTPRWATGRLTPSAFVRCRFRCDELYDQTPGPAAGERVGAEP